MSRFQGDFWIFTLLSVLFWILAALVWGRVGEISTDAFNDLTTAMRLEAGERLYQQLQWLHGPVPPGAVYLVRAVFGRTVNAYLALCAVTAWAEWALAYRLARRFTGPAGGAAAVLVIWGFFTFEPDGFARLLPVNYSSLLSAALVMWVFNLLADDSFPGTVTGTAAGLPAGGSPSSPGKGRVWLSAAAVSVTLLSKVEFGLAVWAALMLHSVMHPDRIYRLAVAVCLPAGLYAAACALLPGFWATTAPGAVASNELGRAYLIYGGAVVSWSLAGHFVANLVTSSGIALGILGFASALRDRRWLPASGWLIAGAAAAVAVNFPDPLGMGGTVLRRMALRSSFSFAVTGLLWGAAGSIRNRDERWILPLYAGALFLLARNPNQLLPERYAAFYMVPALVLSARPLRALVIRLQGPAGSAIRPAVRGDLVFLILLVPAAVHAADAAWRFSQKTYSLGEATEPVRTYERRSIPLRSAINYLNARLKPGDRIAVVPNEPVIYYATGALPSFPDHNYIGHLVRGDDERWLAERAMTTARFVVFSSWQYAEFGMARAGAGFAEDLQRQLDARGRFLTEFANHPAALRLPPKPRGVYEPYYRIRIWEIPENAR